MIRPASFFLLLALLPLAGCESEPEPPPAEKSEAREARPAKEEPAPIPIEQQPLYNTVMPAEGPDAAPESGPNLIAGGDFENVSELKAPWYSRAHARRDTYIFRVDDTLSHTGKASLRIEQIKPESWAALMQRIRYDVTMGPELELTAMLAGSGLTEAPNLLYRTKGGAQVPAGADTRIDTDEVNGGWVKGRLRIQVPEGTQIVEIGIAHHGPGKLWIDDVAVRAVNPL